MTDPMYCTLCGHKISERLVLDLPMDENDAKAATIRDYLKALLSKLWAEDEGFSGKRPFGNSSWSYDLYRPLIKAGMIEGDADPDYPSPRNDEERKKADKIISEAIDALT